MVPVMIWCSHLKGLKTIWLEFSTLQQFLFVWSSIRHVWLTNRWLFKVKMICLLPIVLYNTCKVKTKVSKCSVVYFFLSMCYLIKFVHVSYSILLCVIFYTLNHIPMYPIMTRRLPWEAGHQRGDIGGALKQIFFFFVSYKWQTHYRHMSTILILLCTAPIYFIQSLKVKKVNTFFF